MIDGDLQVIERDGRPLVVDQSGDAVVCRSESYPRSSSRRYHNLDVEAYAEQGIIKPACGYSVVTDETTDVMWIPRRKADLDANWDGCSYTACFGEYHPSDPTGQHPQNGLAARLEAMSVEEFDAATQQTLRTDGGEQ